MGAQTSYRYSRTVGTFAIPANIGGLRLFGFTNPVDIALDRDGVLYVLSRGMAFQRVTVLTLDEDLLVDFGSNGTEDGEMMWPVSIALDGDRNIYVSDEALQRISTFDREGQFLGKWDVHGSGGGEFDRPTGIAFDHEDNLLVVDGLNNRIQKYTRDGHYMGGWGREDRRDGEFNVPWGICVDKAGDVYVADWRNDRIQKFDPDGKHLATWGESGTGDRQFSRPSGVAVDEDGDIYVAGWGNERVQVLGPDGNFIAKLRGESGLSRWAEEYVRYSENDYEERQKADLDPELDLPPSDDFLRQESANKEKLLWGPTAVKVDPDGLIYIADGCRHRVQVYCKEHRSPAGAHSGREKATARSRRLP